MLAQVHTLEVRVRVSPHQLQLIDQALRRRGGCHAQSQYAKEGIPHFRFSVHTESSYYALVLQVDPALLLGRTPFSLTPCDVLRRELVPALNEWLLRRGRFRNNLSWVIDRVDIAADIVCASQAEVSAWVSLFQNGFIPSNMENRLDYGWVGSSRVGNQRELFQSYDKSYQLQQRYPDTDLAVLSQYLNVFRIECQLQKERLRDIRKEAGFPYRSLEYFLREDFAEAVLRQRIDEIIGNGPHVNLSRALQVLGAHKGNQKINGTEQPKLAKFLRWIDGISNIAEARRRCQDKQGPVSAATFGKYVSRLSTLGIGLPLIPKDAGVARMGHLLPQALAGVPVTIKEWIRRQRDSWVSRPAINLSEEECQDFFQQCGLACSSTESLLPASQPRAAVAQVRFSAQRIVIGAYQSLLS